MSTPPTPATKKYPASYFFVAVCIVLMLAIVGFSIYYISNLGQDVLLQFEAIAETLPLPSVPAGQPVNQTITVEVNRSSLLSADYLAVVLPVLLTVAGAFIVFLGMNRLKMYDDRIDGMRATLLSEISTIVEGQVTSGQAKHLQSIKDTMDEKSNNFKKEVTTAKDSLADLASQHIQKINDAASDYDWLKPAITQINIPFREVHTVFDAHKLIEPLRREKPDNYYPLIKEIVTHVISETLSGDPADYHNLSAELARGSMYSDAVQILEKGLSLFPFDTDLLSSFLSYATKGGMDDKAKDALKKLLEIDRRLWTWRCYSFCCDYYISGGKLDLALKMCDECISAFPTNQHGYHDKSNVVKMLTPGMAGIDASINVLKSAIAANINCPQCSNELGEIYLELGQFEDALEAFNRTVLDLAIAQPGINESYVFYNRGSCYDRMFIRSLNTDTPDTELLVNAHNDYVTALKLGELSVITSTQARARLEFLKRFLPDVGTTE